MKFITSLAIIFSFSGHAANEWFQIRDSLSTLDDSPEVRTPWKSETEFVVKGWYLNYVEPGFRGEKSFSISGSSKHDGIFSGDQMKISSRSSLTAQTDSMFWATPGYRETCTLSQDFEIDLKGLKSEFKDPASKNTCSLYLSVLRQVSHLMYFPVGWPVEVEAPAGPTYISPETVHPIMTKTFETFPAKHQLQWTILDQKDSVIELDVNGNVTVEGEAVRIYGKFSWHVLKKYVTRLNYTYIFTQERKFPDDKGKLTHMTIELRRK